MSIKDKWIEGSFQQNKLDSIFNWKKIWEEFHKVCLVTDFKGSLLLGNKTNIKSNSMWRGSFKNIQNYSRRTIWSNYSNI